MTYQGIYANLLAQFEAVYRHNRQGSIKTKHRYREAWLRFLLFLAQIFRLENIKNIRDKHIVAYVEDLKGKGRSAAYIKVELSALRFSHEQIPRAKYDLPTNADLGIERRRYGGVDRTWSGREFNMAIVIALRQCREDYVAVLCLTRYAALRLHECFRLDRSTAEIAVNTGLLTVTGKGGLRRTVPINSSIEWVPKVGNSHLKSRFCTQTLRRKFSLGCVYRVWLNIMSLGIQTR